MAYKKGNEIPTIDVALVTVEDASGNMLGLNTASQISVTPGTETTDAVKLIIKGVLVAQKPQKTTLTGNAITLTDNVFNPQIVQLLQGGTITYSKAYSVTTATAGKHYFAVDDYYVQFELSAELADGQKLEYNDVSGVLAIKTTADNKIVRKVARELVHTQPSGDYTSLTMTNTSDTSRIASYLPPEAGEAAEQEAFTLRAYSAIYNAAGIITGYECIKYPNCQGVPIALSSQDDVFRVPEYTINSAPDTGERPYEITYIPELPQVDIT